MRPMKLALATLCLTVGASTASPQAPPTAGAPEPRPRPRVVLALSGGGARGIAHVGALRALEEAGIPVDAIAANSMGAVVGGVYATGRTSAELEHIVRSLDWASLFSGRPDRRTLPVSRRQDREGGIGPSRSARALSAVFLVVFALTLSIVSFHLLLSLDAHWFSTMFAVLVFTDFVQTGTAFVAIVAGWLVLTGRLQGFLNENHLHSLGKMVFASTGFWAYIYFCQHMLIWYANLPEETIYFVRRASNGWLPYLLILPVLKFVVPFLLLVPREAKRNPRRLVPVAALIVFAQFWELYVMVAPAMGHGDHPAHGHLPLVELAATLGFLGLFVLVFGWALARHDAVPLKDPALAECLDYHC